jgi:hypothetical protein
MGVNKFVLIALCLFLFSSLVFSATTTKNNSVTRFNASVNSSSNQIVMDIACKYQAIGTLSSTDGSSKDLICPSFSLTPETVTFNGGLPAFPLKITFTIPAPCDVCSKNLTLSAPDTPTSSDVPNDPLMSYAIVFIIVIIVVLGFVLIFEKLKR